MSPSTFPTTNCSIKLQASSEHQVVYYLTLIAIFLAGVAEVYAAILLNSGQDAGRGRACARPLLCADVVPLAFLVALGGTPVLVMG